MLNFWILSRHAKTSLVATTKSTLDRRNLLLGTTRLMINATLCHICMRLQPSTLSCILSKEQSTFCLLKFSQEGFGLITANMLPSANQALSTGHIKKTPETSQCVKKIVYLQNKSHGIHWDSIPLAHPAPFTCHILSCSLPAWGPSFSSKQPNLREVGSGLMWTR